MRQRLAFGINVHPGGGFAILSRGDLWLLLSMPGGGAGAGRSAMRSLWAIDASRSCSVTLQATRLHSSSLGAKGPVLPYCSR